MPIWVDAKCCGDQAVTNALTPFCNEGMQLWPVLLPIFQHRPTVHPNIARHQCHMRKHQVVRHVPTSSATAHRPSSSPWGPPCVPRRQLMFALQAKRGNENSPCQNICCMTRRISHSIIVCVNHHNAWKVFTPNKEATEQCKELALIYCRLLASRVQHMYHAGRQLLGEKLQRLPWRVEQHCTNASKGRVIWWPKGRICWNKPNCIWGRTGPAQLTRSGELPKFHMQLQSQQRSVIKLGRMTAVSMLRHNS